jgi:hypothetical protein
MLSNYTDKMTTQKENSDVITGNITKLQTIIKSRMVKVPIIETIKLIYRPTSSHINALIVDPTFSELDKGVMLYVECGSQHGILSLIDIPQQRAHGLPVFLNGHGAYDRDPIRRTIEAVYLPPDNVIESAYCGTLDELLHNQNITRRR